ncbi:MAG: XdhC family protein [Anaerolineae bacterium]|nr:XdhC family protein [Anaerolineae bacterium]
MSRIYEDIEQHVRGGETIATATVVTTQGSTPREVGAKMVVRPTGETLGSIGGGCGEAEVWQAAMDALKDGQPRLVTLDLTGDVALDTEMVCGGVMQVFVELWDSRDLELLGRANKAMEESGGFVSITPISTEANVLRRLVLQSGEAIGTLGDEDLDALATSWALQALREGKSQTVPGTENRPSVFLDVQVGPPTLLIAGAGHIAVPLARMGSMLGFRVVVVDDRPIFANAERFPEADEVIAAPFGETLASYPMDDQTYVAIMTRGHAHDLECLVEVIDKPAAYIGMIGSRRRVRGVLDLVRGRDVSEELLARVHAPIGLDIGALTPEEIAVSVISEVVKARRGGTGRSLSAKDD